MLCHVAGGGMVDDPAVPVAPSQADVAVGRESLELAVADLMIELRPSDEARTATNGPQSFQRAVRRETIRRRVRVLAKAMFQTAMQWRRRMH